ncbi:MAG: leucine-rich repeat domain-containing protein [Ruminococcaceae bacterium]|nr:leucine-rich repeat domain-containing protein [Oscillospiraceae bacterium]
MSEQMAIMPHSHYKNACDFIREITGKTDPIKSGDWATEAKAAFESNSGSGATIKYSEGLEFFAITYNDVSGYNVMGIGDCTDTDVVIPPTHDGLPVISIDLTAFLGNASIVSAVIPTSVLRIRYSAFNSCSNLKTVTICNPNVEMECFSGIAGMYTMFSGCDNLTDIYVPWGEGEKEGAPWGAPNATIHYDTDVSRYDFVDYEAMAKELQGKLDVAQNNLVSVIGRTIKEISSQDLDGATNVGPYAFYNCSLVHVELPDTVTSIGGSAFSSCRSLESVVVSAGIQNIYASVFSSCQALQLVDFSKCTQVPVIPNTSVFTGVPTTCVILLPDALYDEWIVATNWVALAVTYVKKSEYVEGAEA